MRLIRNVPPLSPLRDTPRPVQVREPLDAPLRRLILQHLRLAAQLFRNIKHVFQILRLTSRTIPPGDIHLNGIEPQVP